MRAFLLRRILLAIPTIIGVTALIFAIMRMLPGDPLIVVFGIEQVTRMKPEERASLMHDMGFDAPWPVQYARWMKDLATGRFGESFLRGDPLSKMLANRGPITAEIGILAVIISWLVGIPVGIISALKPNSILDAVSSFMAVLFLAIPGFWLGLLIVLLLVSTIHYKAPIVASQIWRDPWANFQMVIGPAVIMGLGAAAQVARIARSSLFEVLREDYVRTARAKGLMDRLVLVRHALPNAMLPVITLTSLILGYALGGSVAIETAFGVPGLGRTLVVATVERDMSVVQNLVFLYSVVFVLINILVDISYARLDPRIRFQ